jgi:hypothetical protein
MKKKNTGYFIGYLITSTRGSVTQICVVLSQIFASVFFGMIHHPN